MTRSLGEIESLAKRAARGAGLPWAIAEEAAVATRWLQSFDLPGCEILAGYLASPFGGAPATLQPPWSCNGPLCPILSGASLCDCADVLTYEPLLLHQVSHPLLLLPFVARAARTLRYPLSIGWAKTDGVCLRLHSLPKNNPQDVICQITTPFAEAQQPGLRGKVPAEAWDALQAFAARTYAPATDASRRLGAGAGLTDSD